MPPEKDWRAPPDEAGDDALQYSDIAIGYLSRNVRYRSDYRRALGRVKRGTISADNTTANLVDNTTANTKSHRQCWCGVPAPGLD